jgi:hypothetical protein
MNHKTGPHHLGTKSSCSQTRLAESAVAAVDLCSCGTLQLHLGPLTLRLAPCALTELRTTVDRAMAAYAAREVAPEVRDASVGFFASKRGNA